MKTIRFSAGVLLIVTGILHFLPSIKMPEDPNALPMLIFGIVYLSVGVLLLLNRKIAPILGILFPVIGLATGFFVLGMSNWDTMLTIMFIIDAVVIICCIILLFNGKKGKIESS